MQNAARKLLPFLSISIILVIFMFLTPGKAFAEDIQSVEYIDSDTDTASDDDDSDTSSVYYMGDVDMSGTVTVDDALAVLQYYIKWGIVITGNNYTLADMDYDNELTVSDALLILKTYIKQLSLTEIELEATDNDNFYYTRTSLSTEEIIWNFFIGKGLNAYATAGIMGNLYAESTLRANNLQDIYNSSLGMTDDEYTAAVDNGTYTNFVYDSAGYGLAQWTYWSLKQGLLAYAQSTYSSIGNTTMQLNYLWIELNDEYPSTLSALKSATSVREASDIFLTQFERPSDQSESVKALRASYGQVYYDKYAN